MKKNADPQKALLVYRNTPIEGIDLSPAQMFMGRRLKTALPMATELLKPENTKTIKEKLRMRQQSQKKYHDMRSSKGLKSLEPGQNVAILHDKKWIPGTVLNKHPTPRSYVVETSSGSKLRRNRQHINTTQADLQRGEIRDPGTLLRYETRRNNTENPDINENQPVQHETRSSVQPDQCAKTVVNVRRSGREIKPPVRFKDYV